MIKDKRKLWLMISCSITFMTPEKQNDYADRFIKGLNQEEVEFCLSYMKKESK